MTYQEVIKNLAPSEYQCSSCGEVYEKGWTDDEATAEREENFPGFTEADCAIICDDCYQMMMGKVAVS
jgi:hypothetical protein